MQMVKGILCDFFIFTLEQIIVLNKYCTYNQQTYSQNITCQNTTELVKNEIQNKIK